MMARNTSTKQYWIDAALYQVKFFKHLFRFMMMIVVIARIEEVIDYSWYSVITYTLIWVVGLTWLCSPLIIEKYKMEGR